MYTQKNFNDDLFKICQSHFVKFKLLQDFANERISQDDFENQISSRKNEDEINEVLNEVNKLQQKIKQNGGRFDEDPISAAKGLRKSGKIQEAFKKIVPYMCNMSKTSGKDNLLTSNNIEVR